MGLCLVYCSEVQITAAKSFIILATETMACKELPLIMLEARKVSWSRRHDIHHNDVQHNDTRHYS